MPRPNRLFAIVAALAAIVSSAPAAQAQTKTIVGVEFSVKSATVLGSSPDLRLILAIHNSNKDSIGLFFMTNETSLETDSGASYKGYTAGHPSGIMFCGSDRNACASQKSSYTTTIPGNQTDDVVIQFGGASSDEGRKLAHAAKLADFTATMYLAIGSGETGFVPLSLADIPVRVPLK